MNIWIFQTGEPMPHDGGMPRPMRAISLTKSLLELGVDITIFTSRFDHFSKSHRVGSKCIELEGGRLKVNQVSSSGYKNNIGFKRIVDHVCLSLGLAGLLTEYTRKERPCLAIVGYPPVEFAFVAALYLKWLKVPYVLDVKDLWPEIFYVEHTGIKKHLIKAVFWPYMAMFRWMIANAKAITSMTDEFLDHVKGIQMFSRAMDSFSIPLVATNTARAIDGGEEDIDRGKILAQEVSQRAKGRRICFFVGNWMAKSFNFGPVITAIHESFEGNDEIFFVIAGSGELDEFIVDSIGGMENVYLPGRINGEEIRRISELSAIGIAPVINRFDYKLSIPNKVMDYVVNGLPVATPLVGATRNYLRKYGIGLFYDDADPRSLIRLLRSIFRDNETLDATKRRARSFSEEYKKCDQYSLAATRLLKLVV